MSAATRLDPPTASGATSLPPTPPAPVLPVGVVALVLTVVAGAALTRVVVSLLALIGHPPVPVTVLAWVVVALAWLPTVPAAQALGQARHRAGSVAAGDLVRARRAAAAGREDAATALGYALAVLIGAGLIGFAIASDAAISRTFLRWDFIEQAWWGVTKAFWVNIRVAAGAEVLVLVVGLVIAVMRLLPGRSGRPLRWLAILYVDTFRAIPSIIVLYLVGFGLSLAKVPVFEDLSPMWLAIVALTLTYSGYVAEVYRAGIESIHPSQWAAARSLGLSYGLTLRTVIIPQAVRRIVPPLLNDFVGLQKDTALIGVMGVTDAFNQSRLVSSSVFNLSPVIVVAVLFVIITIPQARLVDRLIARDQGRKGGRTS